MGSAWRQVATVDVIAAAADKHGGLWLALLGDNKLRYYKAGQLTALDQPLSTARVRSMIVNSQDRLWIAYSDRLLRYDHGRRSEWQTITSPVFDIDRMAADPVGRIWIVEQPSTSSTGDASIAVYDPALDHQP
jgi:streptogramin lyase